MKRLLTIELRKIWLNRASRILTLIYFILLTFIALIASIKFEFGNFRLHFAEMGIFNFPYIWHFNTYMADFFKYFLALVIVSMTANEYTYGTLKQNLIDGLSKKEFVLSKFLTVLLFAVGSALFVFVLSIILGLIFSSYTEFGIIFSDMQYLFAYLLKLSCYFSLCLFAGMLIKRSAFAIGFVLVWSMAEGLLYGLLRWQIANETVADAVLSVFPMQAMSNLIPEPFSRLNVIQSIQQQIGVGQMKDYGVHFFDVAVVLVWITIFILGAYKILQRRDL